MPPRTINLKDVDPSQIKVIQAAPPAQDSPEAFKPRTVNLRDLDLSQARLVSPGIREEKGIGDTILGGISAVGEFVESHTAAPARAGLHELLRTEKEFAKPEPSVLGNIQAAGSAFAEQFGTDSSKAPRGEEIAAERLGAGTEEQDVITPLGGLGFGSDRPFPKSSTAKGVGAILDLAVDPLNVIPASTVAKVTKGLGKGVLKTAGATSKLGLDVAKKIGPTAAIEFAEGAAVGAKNAIKALTKAEVSKDFDKFAELAGRHGIEVDDIDAIRFHKDSSLAELARVRMQTLGGEGMRELFNRKLQQVQQATVDFSTRVSGGALPNSSTAAGEVLQDALKNTRDRFFKSIDTSYKRVATENPGLAMSDTAQKAIRGKLDEVSEISDRLFRSRGTRNRAIALRDHIDDFAESGGSFENTTDLLQNLRETIFAPQSREIFIDKDIAKLRELSFTVREGLLDTVTKNVDEATGIRLTEANKRMTDFFGINKPINKSLNAALDGTLAPEKLYDRLIKNGDSLTLNSIKTIIQDTPELKQLQGFMLNEQLVPGGLTDDVLFKSAVTRNNLLNKKTSARLSQFVDSGDLEEFSNLVALGDEFGTAVANPSKSGIVNMLAGGVKNIAKVSGLLEGTLALQKGRAFRKQALGLQLPKAARPLFGPQAIGATEAFGLRLPQQISRQQQGDK